MVKTKRAHQALLQAKNLLPVVQWAKKPLTKPQAKAHLLLQKNLQAQMQQSQPRQQVQQQNQTEQMQVLQKQANHAQAALQAKQTHNDCFHSKQRNPALFFIFCPIFYS